MKPKAECEATGPMQNLLRVAEAIEGELTVWYCTGDPRPASWAKFRINRLRAAIAKAEGAEGE